MNRNQRGFTVLELLTVIGIIFAVIAVALVAIVSFVKGREAAQAKAAAATPTINIGKEKLYVERTEYHYTNRVYTSEIDEFQYKGHSYIRLTSYNLLHAGHCPCRTNLNLLSF